MALTLHVKLGFELKLTRNPEIRDDIQEECEKFGRILSLKIPRPTGASRQSAGVGRIFIKYETPDSATKALRALAGRKFADRTVVSTYFPEVNINITPHFVARPSPFC